MVFVYSVLVALVGNSNSRFVWVPIVLQIILIIPTKACAFLRNSRSMFAGYSTCHSSCTWSCYPNSSQRDRLLLNIFRFIFVLFVLCLLGGMPDSYLFQLLELI